MEQPPPPAPPPGVGADLGALRDAVAAVVDAPPPGGGGAPAADSAGAPLAALVQRNELLCGAGRGLVTPPLLRALHLRVAALSPGKDAPGGGEWAQGFLALRLLADLAAAGVAPPPRRAAAPPLRMGHDPICDSLRVPPAHPAGGAYPAVAGGGAGAAPPPAAAAGAEGVTHSDLVKSAEDAIALLQRSDLLHAARRDAELAPAPRQLQRLLVATFNAAWSLLGALAEGSHAAAAAPFVAALRDPDTRPLLLLPGCWGAFADAAAAAAAALSDAGRAAEARALLVELFSLDAPPSAWLCNAAAYARAHSLPATLESEAGVPCYLGALRDWVSFRFAVVRAARGLLDRPAPRRRGWLDWLVTRGGPARLRAAVVAALGEVWRRGGAVPGVWSGVACFLAREGGEALSAAEYAEVQRLCAEYFLSPRPAAVYDAASVPLPAPLRLRVAEVAKLMSASAARRFDSDAPPAWLDAAAPAARAELRDRAGDALLAVGFAGELLFTRGGELNTHFVRHAAAHGSVIGVYRTLLARLAAAAGAGASPRFPAALAAHCDRVGAATAAAAADGRPAFSALAAHGRACFPTVAWVVCEAAHDAGAAARADLLRALDSSWPFFRRSTAPSPPPRGSAPDARQRYAEAAEVFETVETALCRLLAPEDGAAAAALRRAEEAERRITAPPPPDADAHAPGAPSWEMLRLRCAVRRAAPPAPVLRGALGLALRALAAPGDNAPARGVETRRRAAHDLFLAAAARPAPDAAPALCRYAHLCVAARPGADGRVRAELQRLPNARLVGLFVQGLPQLQESLDEWGLDPAGDGAGLDADGVLLYLVELLDAAAGGLTAAAAASRMLHAVGGLNSSSEEASCRLLRDFYVAALVSIVPSQRPRVGEAAAAAARRALRAVAQRDGPPAVAWWLRHLRNVVVHTDKPGSKEGLVKWFLRLQHELGSPPPAAKL